MALMASYDDELRGGPAIRWVAVLVGLIAMLVVVISGWQQGPFGRHQIVGLNPQEEAHLGAQTFQQVLSESDVVQSGPVVQVVNKIGRRLAEASVNREVLAMLKLPPQRFEWEFRVIRSRQVNAFCLPGGKVVVYTGILPVCETESGLATVMGHEIGHALAHHGAERMAQEKLVSIGTSAVAGSLDNVSPEQRRQIFAVLGAGSKFGILLPFSRKHESEADHIGLLLMAAAGYNPEEASIFWGRMQKMAGGGKPPEFMSTHPSDERRAADLRAWLNQAIPLYEHSNRQPGNTRLPSL
jgi:predicted Zn-dependent protease